MKSIPILTETVNVPAARDNLEKIFPEIAFPIDPKIWFEAYGAIVNWETICLDFPDEKDYLLFLLKWG